MKAFAKLVSHTLVLAAGIGGATLALASDYWGAESWRSFPKEGGSLPAHLTRPQARWGVGNGGDSLRLNLTKAREYAAMLATKASPEVLRAAGADEDIMAFMAAHGRKLAADIQASDHVWLQEAKPTCAWTQMPDGDAPNPEPIQFSYPTCRSTVDSYLAATLLLIHESAHHFHKEEAFADRLALALVSAWQKGLLQWLPVARYGAPSARMGHGAAYLPAADAVVVYGGRDHNGNALKSGGVYHLGSQAWSPLATPPSPGVSQPQLAVSGQHLLVWGGFTGDSNGSDWFDGGALYHVPTGSWSKVAAPYKAAGPYHLEDAPAQAVVPLPSGLFFVWGGQGAKGEALGGLYNPTDRVWLAVSKRDAPARLGGHTVVAVDGPTGFTAANGQSVAGEGVIVWGGYTGDSFADRDATAAGAYYHVASDTWYPLADSGAPNGRTGHKAVWTGAQMMIFSGAANRRGAADRSLHATGGLYDLAHNKWQAFTSQIGVERTGHTMVWSGKEVLIMGGKSRNLKSYYSDVIAFDPEGMTWRSVSGRQAPDIRWQHSAVWTGNGMVVWGGGLGFYSEPLADGGVFFP